MSKAVTVDGIAAFHAYFWQEFTGLGSYDSANFESIGGEIELCLELAEVSSAADVALTELAMEDGLPGVFHYERMNEFAGMMMDYFLRHGHLPSRDRVALTMELIVKEWRKNG